MGAVTEKIRIKDEASKILAFLAKKAGKAAEAFGELEGRAGDLGGELGSLGSKIGAIPVPGMEALGAATTMVGDTLEALTNPVGLAVVGIAGIGAAAAGTAAGLVALVSAAEDWAAELTGIAGLDPVIGGSDVAAITAANAAFDMLTTSAKSVGVALAGDVAPQIERMAILTAAAALAAGDLAADFGGLDELLAGLGQRITAAVIGPLNMLDLAVAGLAAAFGLFGDTFSSTVQVLDNFSVSGEVFGLVMGEAEDAVVSAEKELDPYIKRIEEMTAAMRDAATAGAEMSATLVLAEADLSDLLPSSPGPQLTQDLVSASGAAEDLETKVGGLVRGVDLLRLSSEAALEMLLGMSAVDVSSALGGTSVQGGGTGLFQDLTFADDGATEAIQAAFASTPVRDAISSAMGGVSAGAEKFAGAASALSDAFSSPEAMLDAIGQATGPIGQAITEGIKLGNILGDTEAMGELFDGLADMIIDGIAGLIVGIPTLLLELIPELVGRLVTELPQAIGQAVSDAITGPITNTVRWAKEQTGKGVSAAAGVFGFDATPESEQRAGGGSSASRSSRGGNVNVSFQSFMADRNGIRDAVREMNRHLGPRRSGLTFRAGAEAT